MPLREAQMVGQGVRAIQTEAGWEFQSSHLNEHGTGYEMTVSTPMRGNVDIVFYQVICFQKARDPDFSVSLPFDKAADMVKALAAGTNMAWAAGREMHLN